jgi:cell division protein FtsN
MRVIVIAWVAIAGAGCSVQRVPLRDPQTSAPPSSKPYDFEAEAKPPAAPAVAAAPAQGAEADAPVMDLPATADLGSAAVVVEDLPVAPPPESSPNSSPPPEPAGSQRSGYRVQVFAGTDADAAERVRRDLETRLGVQASVDREGAYYKVRAGNCVESQACRELQERLRDAGFASVWIVPAQVEP